MSETTQLPHCGKCGATLSGNAPDGLCAACLLESAFDIPDEGTLAKPGPLLAFNDYELLAEIARGGMGVVYRARQISLNRIVAIKMILGGHLANAAEVQRFRAEAETAAQLQHPNIVAIHEVGEHAGQPFFSMDLVEGRNLAQLVRDEPLPARKAATYLKTIAEAVQYAHSRGVLHRDLKPSNVLIDRNDQPRITDFGLAKRLTGSPLSTNDPQLTQTGQVLGSPSFIPPEQAAGQKEKISPASDVYSLGAILYHLLVGRPPFAAESMTETLRMVAENAPVSPRLLNASVPRDLETICLKCLEKEPNRRYGGAQELADDLDRFLHNEPIQARPIGQIAKTWRWSRRNPGLTAAISLLLLVAIGSPIVSFHISRANHRAETNEEKARIEAAKNAAISLGSLAAELRRQADLPRAEQVLREALALQGTLLNAADPKLAATAQDLATTLEQQGKTAEAELLLREGFSAKRAALGDENHSVFTWLGVLVKFLMRNGKYQDADDLMNQMLPPTLVNKPENVELLAWSARHSARRGRWQDAIPLYKRVIELAPTNHYECHNLAPLLVATGDEGGYRQLCRRMLGTFKGNRNPVVSDVVAKDCLLLPPTPEQLPQIAEFADTAVSVRATHAALPWFQITKALAEYRQGKPANAADWATKALTLSGKSVERDVLGYAVLALAHHRLGHFEEARTQLAKGFEKAEAEFPKSETGNLDDSWLDRLIAKTLLAEAKAVIEGRSFEGIRDSAPKQ